MWNQWYMILAYCFIAFGLGFIVGTQVQDIVNAMKDFEQEQHGHKIKKTNP